MTEPTDRGASAMDRARLLQLIDAYGADPERWPASERAAAQALLARDPAAQRLQREAAELDALLDGGVALEPSAALRRAVAEIPLRAPPAALPIPALPWLLSSLTRAVLAAAAVLALGVLAGAATSTTGGDDEPVAGTAVAVDQDDARAAEDDDGQDSFDTLVELAFNDALDEEQEP